MSTDVVSAFEEALTAIDVGVTRTTTGEFETALANATEQPAIGTPLPFDGVSLGGTDVSLEPTSGDLEEAATGVTPAGLGIAEHGSVVLRSTEAGTEPVSLYPPKHVAVLQGSDVVPDVGSALSWLEEEFAAGRESAIVATGASATGDMGALVQGVHGPETVHVIVLTDSAGERENQQ